MNKPLSVRTKIKASVVLVLLIVVSVSGVWANTRLGTDSSGQSWADVENDKITNSNGKAWTATGANLQLAIYDLNGTGGSVYIPVGEIDLTNSICIPEIIDILGSGMNETVLDWQGNNVVCFNASASSGTDYGGSIKNLYIKQGGTGILVNNMASFEVHKVKIISMDDYGVHTTSTAYHTLISQCRIIADIDGTGILFDANGGEAEGCDFAGYNGSTNVNISANGVTLNNNWFEIGPDKGNSSTTHIIIDGPSSIVIKGNFIGSTRNGGDQIKVIGNAANIGILNNNFGGANTTCINFSASDSNFNIVGNTFDLWQDYAILINDGNYYNIESNIFYTTSAKNPSGFIYATDVNRVVNVIGNIFYMNAATYIYAAQNVNIFDDNRVNCCAGVSVCNIASNNIINGNDNSIITWGIFQCRYIVSGNIIQNCKHGIGVHTSDVVVIGNTISNNMDTSGIYVDSDNCTVSSNTILDTDDNNVVLTASSEYCLITGNNIKGPISESGTNNLFVNNNGYITENGGAETSVDDGDTIVHGLASTPTYVLANCNESAIVAITAKDGTDFTVSLKDHAGNAVNGVTVYWRAYYEP